MGCQVAEDLSEIQFLSRNEAWGVAIGPTGQDAAGNYVLLHTTDAGRTWRELPLSTEYAVPPSFWFLDRETGWFGCWNVPCSIAEPKLFRTDDAGGHWRQVSNETTAVDMAFSDGASGIAHEFGVDDSGGIVRTSDGGRHWETVSIPHLKRVERTRFLSGRVGWVTGHDGADLLLFRTLDGGDSWQEFRTTLPSGWPEIREITFLDRNRGWLVLKHKGDDQIRILATSDGGKIWFPLGTPPLRTTRWWADIVRFVSAKTGFLFVTEEDNPQSKGFEGQNVLYTADGGAHWRKYPLPYSVDSCQVFEGDLLCSASSAQSRIGVLTLHPN